jgi:hypothetical protein
MRPALTNWPIESGQNKEKLREEFYTKVQNVPIKDEHQIQLYQHCNFRIFFK